MNEALAHVRNSGSGINDDFAESDPFCPTCLTVPDVYQCCLCSPIGVVCAWGCDGMIAMGSGIAAWEAGDDSQVSHGLCATCALAVE